MIAAVILGVRLALGSAGRRVRSLLVVAAAGLSALVLLSVITIAGAATAAQADYYSGEDMARLMAAVVGAVALPVLALCGTVGRLSAAMRDRRLANLRLLGLTSARTRLVAAAEAGTGAVLGTLLGAAGFWLIRPLLTRVDVGGATWAADQLTPSLRSWLGVLVGVPLVVVAVAVLPRLGSKAALARARRLDARRPPYLLTLPLIAGLVLSYFAWHVNDDHVISDRDAVVLFTSIGLIGLGVVLVVPFLVRLLADTVLRLGRGPIAVVAGRRLQAQPAGVNRLVAALLIGLFLVIGARSVVTAFESTPQYQSAANAIEKEQQTVAPAPAGKVDQVARRARSVDIVRDVKSYPVLRGRCGPGVGRCDVMVATCDQIAAFAPGPTGCVDGQVQSLGWMPNFAKDSFTVAPMTVNGNRIGDDGVTLPVPTSKVTFAVPETELGWTLIIVPPDTPGLAPLAKRTAHNLVITADPGRDLFERLHEARVHATTMPAFEEYDLVRGLRAIVWTLAAVILSLGLLTFAIAGIDRALSRRRELVGLQLVGTPPRVLSRAQWLEAALPTTVGCLLAIIAGQFAGATFLQLEGNSLSAPWPQAATLAGIALVASLAVAGLTVLATNTRISPDQIRAE